jgi:hypothetical protein
MDVAIGIIIFVMYVCFTIAWELTVLLINLVVFAVCLPFGYRVWLL